MTLHEFKKNVFCIIDSVQIGGEIFECDLSKYDKYTVTKIYPYSTAIYNNKLNVTQIVNRLRNKTIETGQGSVPVVDQALIDGVIDKIRMYNNFSG